MAFFFADLDFARVGGSVTFVLLLGCEELAASAGVVVSSGVWELDGVVGSVVGAVASVGAVSAIEDEGNAKSVDEAAGGGGTVATALCFALPLAPAPLLRAATSVATTGAGKARCSRAASSVLVGGVEY